MGFDPWYFAAALPTVLLSLTLHEFGHAAMAEKLGDPTPRLQGRLTLNPLAHLDPLGTLFIIFMLFGGIGIGWAKPVQTNPTYFKNYRQGLLLVAFAGPLMNICLVMFGLGLAFVTFKTGAEPPAFLKLLLFVWVTTNIALATFNLLPIPPLDGGNILSALLTGNLGESYRRMAPYGMIVLLAMMWLGALRPIFIFVLQIYFALISATLGSDFAHWLLGGMGF